MLNNACFDGRTIGRFRHRKRLNRIRQATHSRGHHKSETEPIREGNRKSLSRTELPVGSYTTA